jgi:ergothioneine biosynthesis protein EgtB
VQTYESIRHQTLNLCAPLTVEDHVVQPYDFVSPPKWHLGHTTWFFETFCLLPHYSMDAFDPHYGYIFNSYYESVGAHVPQNRRGVLSRPTLEDVRAYRAHVDARMREVWNDQPEWRQVVQLGLEHEQQHQELLLMDVKSILFAQPGKPTYAAVGEPGADIPRTSGWDKFAAGIYEVGFDGDGFSFDNEGPRHKVWLDEFSMAKALVTNGDWREFIEDSGYQRPELWLADGWRWVQERSILHPLYWTHSRGEQWCEYSLSRGLQPLHAENPVSHISYFEADAYARWRGCRLPTEAEWEVACGNQSCASHWQWTRSAYLPYPGYQAFAGAFAEYNGKFMNGQMVLRGGCFATPTGHYRPTYRNFYYPEMRWPFSSLRLAR